MNEYSLAFEIFDQKFVAQTRFKPDTFQMLGLNKLGGNVPLSFVNSPLLKQLCLVVYLGFQFKMNRMDTNYESSNEQQS